MASPKSTPPLRERLYQRQKGRCWICLRRMRFHGALGPGKATIDHIVPLGAGGANRPNNKLLAHLHCNQLRGMRPLAVGRSLIISRAISRIALHEQISELLNQETA